MKKYKKNNTYKKLYDYDEYDYDEYDYDDYDYNNKIIILYLNLK
jgi:hypothetical protein